jgi:cation diffusion facilitator family transporter
MAHSSDGSLKVIIYALCANFGIAIAKFIGSYFTKSASLLAEAIHSLVDCTNQIFLLIGAKRSRKEPDDRHPLGYGRESFFWSFIVAIFLFSAGGLFAIYEGIHKLQAHEPISHPIVAVSILVFGIILEAGSFWACYQEVKKQNTYGSLWAWLRKSTAADLIVIFLEDAAALVGLVVALIATGIGWYTGVAAWDAVGSIAIGIVLVGVAAMLASEIKSLLIGEAPSQDYRGAFSQEISRIFPGGELLRLIALQTGGNEVMVSFKLAPGPETTQTRDLIERINELEIRLKKRFPEIRWLFVEPDHHA